MSFCFSFKRPKLTKGLSACRWPLSRSGVPNSPKVCVILSHFPVSQTHQKCVIPTKLSVSRTHKRCLRLAIASLAIQVSQTYQRCVILPHFPASQTNKVCVSMPNFPVSKTHQRCVSLPIASLAFRCPSARQPASRTKRSLSLSMRSM